MGWTEKDQPTPFDDQEIEGLFYLDGDVLAQHLRRAWTRGQKYPLIAFPSGAQLDLWESADREQLGIVHVFGEMDLPLKDSPERAFERACDIGEQCGYSAQRIGEHGLAVLGQDEDEHFLIVYDPEKGIMADVMAVTEEVRRWAEEHLGGKVATEKPIPPGLDLLPASVREKLPALYANEEIGLEAPAVVKYFTPDAGWTWYGSEFDGEDLFFGLVVGLEIELGCFSLAELKAVRGPLGLPIERDLYYQAQSLRQLMEEHERQRRQE